MKLLFRGADIRDFAFHALPIAFTAGVNFSGCTQSEAAHYTRCNAAAHLRRRVQCDDALLASGLVLPATPLALSRLFGQCECRAREFRCQSGESTMR